MAKPTARLVADQDSARAKPVNVGQWVGGRIIHPPSNTYRQPPGDSDVHSTTYPIRHFHAHFSEGVITRLILLSTNANR